MEKNYAVIFRRGEFVEGKGCSLEALDYVEGIEKEIKGKKYFIIDPEFRERSLEELDKEEELYEFFENTKVLRFMENRNNITTKYVYGTPMNTRVLKDLVVYNLGFLDKAFGVKTTDEQYNENVNNLKEGYVTALKMYTFYQNVNRYGEIETSFQRKDPLVYDVEMEGPISNIFTDELGLKFPDDYDIDVDYEKVYKSIPTEIDMRKIYEETKKYIIGQDKHILPILSAINDNLSAEIPEEKANILVCGPTGCGKTAIFKRIAETVGLPIVIEDSTQFTKAGYVGRNISDIFEDLIEAANGDQELAQKGIIIIDEIDKKASGRDDSVSGVGVIQSMLKLLEGGDYTYEVGKGMQQQLKTFNTLNTTIAFSGAFSGLGELAIPPKTLGFGNERKTDKPVGDIYDVSNLDKYGIPPEFVGRITLLEVIDKLTKEDLKNILLTAKINPLDLFIKKMKRFNTTVNIEDGFVEAVAEEAYKSNTGARALYKIMRETTKVAQSEIELMNRNIEKELTLMPETVYDNTLYELKENIKVKTLHR